MIRVEHIEFLTGLVAVPVLLLLLWFLLRWKKKALARIGDEELATRLIGNFSAVRFLVKCGLVLVALALIVLGAANVQKPGSMENVQRKGVDVMLVLDVSKSMLARDIKPSRLERAKQFLLRLVDQLPNDRIGLVLFAGRAYLQMPLTTDHGAAHMYISQASPDVVPTQGTVIADALRMANSAFNSKERKYKSIVLVSDGEDHDPDAAKVAKQLAEDGVQINTVGIGTAEGSPIVDPATGELKKDDQDHTVISKLNEAELQKLAIEAGGTYERLDNIEDALITMTQQIGAAQKKEMSDAEFVDYISYFQWFLGAAMILLLADYFFAERRRTVPPGGVTRVVGLMGFCLMAALPASAQTTNNLIRSGNRAYRNKQLDQSLKQYQAAVDKSPGNPTAHYNLGDAQFRKNQYDAAAKSYDASVSHSESDKAMEEKGLYNKGVALIRQKKLQESIDAWKSALKLDAADSDARANLEKALMEQKQQQRQQQQQQKKNKNNKQDQKKKPDQQQQQPQQPKPQPSKLDKQQAEQLLKALEQRENDLQNKLNQNKVHTPNQPDKDW